MRAWTPSSISCKFFCCAAAAVSFENTPIPNRGRTHGLSKIIWKRRPPLAFDGTYNTRVANIAVIQSGCPAASLESIGLGTSCSSRHSTLPDVTSKNAATAAPTASRYLYVPPAPLSRCDTRSKSSRKRCGRRGRCVLKTQ